MITLFFQMCPGVSCLHRTSGGLRVVHVFYSVSNQHTACASHFQHTQAMKVKEGCTLKRLLSRLECTEAFQGQAEVHLSFWCGKKLKTRSNNLGTVATFFCSTTTRSLSSTLSHTISKKLIASVRPQVEGQVTFDVRLPSFTIEDSVV